MQTYASPLPESCLIQPMEQREQKPNLFGLCRNIVQTRAESSLLGYAEYSRYSTKLIATEEDDSHPIYTVSKAFPPYVRFSSKSSSGSAYFFTTLYLLSVRGRALLFIYMHLWWRLDIARKNKLVGLCACLAQTVRQKILKKSLLCGGNERYFVFLFSSKPCEI